MTRDRDVRAIVIRENVIKHLPRPDVLIGRCLSPEWFPKQIRLGKPSLDLIRRVVFLDIRFAATPIAGVPTDSLTKQLLDLGDEGVMGRKFQTAESYVGGGETTSQRTCVVALWGGDFLDTDFRCPESIGDLGLCNAGRGEVSISPDNSTITILFGPVALYEAFSSQVYRDSGL